LTVGPEFREAALALGMANHADIAGLKAAHPLSAFQDTTVLIKGSRGMALEGYLEN